MKRKYLFYLALFLYIACGTCFSQVSYAEGGTQADFGVGFNYKVVKPENQKSTVGYFDLKMSPGQKQTVQIELSNGTEHEMVIGVSLNGAKTNGNGVIEYGPTTIEDDKSLKYNFVDVVKGPKEVKIPAKSMVPLDLEITMPESSFDGSISGGIQMKQMTKEEKKEEKKAGITNEYAFLVGMILNETDTKVEPDLAFNKAYAGLTNYRNAVFLNFSNVEAEYLEDMTVDAQIMKGDSKEVLYDTKKAGMRMAPNTMIDFPVEMNGDRMEPGEYTAHILVTAGDKKWEWTEKFSITDEEADKFNSQDVSLTQERGINWRLIAMIVGGVVVVALIVFFVVRAIGNNNKKKKKQLKKKKR